MSSPSLESRHIPGNKINQTGARPQVKYESTPDGDVVVVEPSFDADDGDERTLRKDNQVSAEHGKSEKRRGHSRNLSEHFYDATSLTNEPISEESTIEQSNRSYGYRGPPPPSAPAVGQKHRRVFSGDVSNPAEAHRRINSMGNSAAVKRRPFMQERQHQRVDSAGLDILTAAADVSREELAAAAGERVKSSRNPWEGASASTSRRSPIEMVSYDHSTGVPAPPPPRSHQRPYPPPGPPPPPYYGGPLSYPQPPYPPQAFYSGPGYQRPLPPPGSSAYPVQYARGSDPYSKLPSQTPVQQPKLEQRGEDGGGRGVPVTVTEEKNAMTPPPPVPPSHWRGGSTQGVQTYVTAIGVGEGSRTVQPTASHRHAGTNTDMNPPPAGDGHHRKTSSISSWFPSSVYPGDPGDLPLKGHHRSTSSSISFLGFDVGALDNNDATFLHNLQASTGTTVPPFTSSASADVKQNASDSSHSGEDGEDGSTKLAPGGTSKRVRRKCTIEGCPNRVVQGGLCISHGAKRKQCKHPGCNKNVKKAGLCSTHGPARKRCEAEGCTKVAVQGGRCIAHGAKKKLCSMEGCSKQAILSGMCKKHHDQARKDPNYLSSPSGEEFCKVVEKGAASEKLPKGAHKPTHTRGLSIFQEISADTVGDLLAGEAEAGTTNESRPPGHHHRSTFSREFGSLY